MLSQRILCLLLLLIAATPACAMARKQPATDAAFVTHPIFTWSDSDTAHTLAIRVLTPESFGELELRYDTVPGRGSLRAKLFSEKMAGYPRKVHWADLKGLRSGTPYYFTVVSQVKGALTAEKSVRTLPENPESLKFVQGGDMGNTAEMLELHKQAIRTLPEFALIGGDIAYDNGDRSNLAKWEDWLEAWDLGMTTESGRVTPLILAIGNHEVSGTGFGGEKIENSPFFGQFFKQSGKVTYFARNFGDLGTLYALDSGHIASHASQVDWLKEQMRGAQAAQYRMALYHVPLYPSVRSENDAHSTAGRKHWLPVFDQYRLSFGFENHDHALKRTKPLLAGEAVAPGRGTVYIGDGCWGKPARSVTADRPYLEKAEPTLHFWSVELGRDRAQFKAIGIQGEVLDQFVGASGH